MKTTPNKSIETTEKLINKKYVFTVRLSYSYDHNVLECEILRYWFSNCKGIMEILYEK